MTNSTSHPYTTDDQQACALAYLTYLKEKEIFHGSHRITLDVYTAITKNIPNVSVLKKDGSADWRIVWGPAFQFSSLHVQKNMMMVVQQISDPQNYMVAIRGTNFISLSSWKDDLDVGTLCPWLDASGSSNEERYGSISQGTNINLKALLSLKPLSSNGKTTIPGVGLTLEQFLKTLTDRKIRVRFCGHSLGGAMAPTVALYFAQAQGINNSWDRNSNASITITTFAGPSPGNNNFTSYLTSLISSYTRIIDSNDVVPLGWNYNSFKTAQDLYGELKMNKDELKEYDKLLNEIKHKSYTQSSNPIRFTFPLGKEGKLNSSFLKQMVYQHDQSYPNYMGVPEIISIIYGNR